MKNCTNCILDLTDACPRGAGRAVDDSICSNFLEDTKIKFGRWVSVGKRLPTDGESVLMSYAIHGYPNLYIEVGVYTEGRFLKFGENDLVRIFDVKAWMPLPEPYKAESEAE